jgi:anti-sigma factor RsiW
MAAAPSDQEIDAYIDGQLDTEGRFAVEDYLRRHPEHAARVMGDLGKRSALQLLALGHEPMPTRLLDAATRLSAGAPVRRRLWAPLSGLAVAGMAALIFVMVPNPPAYVDDALTSHRVALLRAGMDSQIEAPRFNAQEIRRATNIAVPAVPLDWKVTDVQLFPTERGPALLMAVRTGEGDRLSIFLQRRKNGAPEQPDAIREGAQSVAYWRRGDMSYALVGDSGPREIDAKAEALARTWS